MTTGSSPATKTGCRRKPETYSSYRLLSDGVAHATSAALGVVQSGGSRLSDMAEVNETYIGGQEAGLSGVRAPGKKVLTGIEVEVLEP